MLLFVSVVVVVLCCFLLLFSGWGFCVGSCVGPCVAFVFVLVCGLCHGSLKAVTMQFEIQSLLFLVWMF